MGFPCSIPNVWRILVATVWSTFVLACVSQLLPEDEVVALRRISSRLGNTYWNISQSACVEATAFNRTFDDDRQYSTVACNCSFTNNTVCHVTNILLRGLNLTGSFAVEFGNLTYLREIDLTRNFLSGSIPSVLGQLPLVIFAALGNRLSGTIPNEIGDIITLQQMDLRDNLLVGNLPSSLGNLSRLERLLLSGNNINGTIPRTFGNLRNLTDFRIDGSSVSGRIPDFIGNWMALERLDMQGTSMEGPIPDTISQLRSLTELRISDLNSTSMSFPSLQNITSFGVLILRNCSLIGTIPLYLGNMASLRLLDLSFNMLSGEIPSSLQRLQVQRLQNLFLAHNSLTGAVPQWIADSNSNMDLSYNNFTRSPPYGCQSSNINLVSSHSSTASNLSWCLQQGLPCPRSSNNHRVFVNCGGLGPTTFEGDEYEANGFDEGPSHFEPINDRWGYSSTGVFMAGEQPRYVITNASSMQSTDADIYRTAHIAPSSLKYYGFCMRRGSYRVQLHFAEIMFSDDSTFSSLGRRMFDIAIQGEVVRSNFDIAREANGTGIGFYREFNVDVNSSTLEIHLYWTGKGTIAITRGGVYGPLISAIAVTPNFDVSTHGLSIGAIVGIVASSAVAVVMILFLLWWKGYFGGKDIEDKELRALDLQTGYFSLRQIKHATNNFDIANKIGEGGFGPVYKGVLSDGTTVAVKQLSAKSKQGNREFVNEIGMISALQHHHLVKLFGCCIEGNQLLLIYEYLENNSLARALFGKPEQRLNLDWTTRNKICLGIAKGLAYLHEESRLKIVHRDIKATNVLLDKDLTAKISDFGLTKLNEEENTHISTRIAGTIGYMAPEYAMRGYLTDKADVYNFGVVALEIVTGQSNTDYMPEEEFVDLLDLAYTLQEQGNILELVDPSLGSAHNEKEAMRMFNISLLCASRSPAFRPSMTSVVKMLEGKIPIQVPLVKRRGSVNKEFRFEDVNEEMSFESLKRHSEDSQTLLSASRTDGREHGGVSNSSVYFSSRDEQTQYHSSSSHLPFGSCV